VERLADRGNSVTRNCGFGIAKERVCGDVRSVCCHYYCQSSQEMVFSNLIVKALFFSFVCFSCFRSLEIVSCRDEVGMTEKK
jgi:hypothetical protein